jgi:Polysaccharide lyase family 4, domain II
VRDVIVYIERITTGRGVTGVGRAQVGGVIAKHGCVLGPTAQIAVPLPSSVTIHGDNQRTRVRVTAPQGVSQPTAKNEPKLFELQEGGLVTVEIKPGVTKIDGEDGKLAASWVLGLDTPYFSITDDSGHFRIEQLAPGTYDLTFWQAPIATLAADGTFAYGSPIVVHRSIRVDAKQTTKVSVALPSI